MRAYVELAYGLDHARWAVEHRQGRVPNSLPFGLEALRDHGLELDLRPRPAGFRRVAGKIDHLVADLQVVDAFTASSHRQRRSCDVVLSWDEWTGVPAGWRSVLPGEPPSVTGVMFLTDWARLSTTASRIVRGGLLRSRAVFVHPRSQADLLMSDWDVPADRLHVVPFGIDPEFFRHDGSEVDRDLVFSVGDDNHRDYPTLLRAFEEVRRHRSGSRLLVATSRTIDTDTSGLTVRAGRLGADRPHAYSQAAVVAVATTPNDHGSGLSVVAEAMACSRPWVVTASSAFNDYFTDGDGGYIVPSGDHAAMASAIRHLLDNPDEADALGRMGRERVEQRLTTDVQGAAVAQILHSVVG